MKQLSGLDASFLFLETAQMPMHVGALHIFELPLGYRGDFLADLRAHMATRIPLAPALRRKLAWMPLNLAAPAWVDAEPDLTQHIVGIKLRKGSGQSELEEQVGKLHPVLLDRSRPLWKFHVFSGLAPGEGGQPRVALYTQLHHAAVDGQAAVALAQAILDLSPEPREVVVKAGRQKKGQLGMAEMLRGALAHQVSQMGQIVKAIPSAVGAVSKLAMQATKKGSGVRNLGLAPRTRLNDSVSAQRAFAGVSLPLAELNAARRRHGASLNDAVLAVCAGALRRYFAKHGPLPRKPLIAAVPISLRAQGDTSANNQASMTLVSLGTHLADPGKRLAHVMAAGAAMKAGIGSMKNVLPTDFPSIGVPWLMEGLTAIYGRVHAAERIPPVANVVISNVPGPTVPLYMAGARMLTNYPCSIVVHGVALNITVQTYDQSLDVGIMACAQAMPEVTEFAAHLETAFEEFKALPAPPAEPAPVPAKRKPRARKAVAHATSGSRASAPSRRAAAR